VLSCFRVDQRGRSLSSENRAENLEDARSAMSWVEVCAAHSSVCWVLSNTSKNGSLFWTVGKGFSRELIQSIQTWPKQGTALGNYAHNATWKADLGQQRTCRED